MKTRLQYAGNAVALMILLEQSLSLSDEVPLQYL